MPIPAHRYQSRRDKLLRSLSKARVDALLVTNFTNVTYLTGFTGDDSYLLLDDRGATLLSDPRYTTQIEEECPGLAMRIRPPGTGIQDLVVQTLSGATGKRLGVEADSMTVGLRDSLAGKLSAFALTPISGAVEELRLLKDADEVELIREAARYAERAFGVVRAAVRGSTTERDLATELEYQLRLFGAVGCSFPSIVAVGHRAALPHARPTGQRLDAADFVLIDWGAAGQLYKSDLTRVLVTGKISPKLERIYRVVLTAQEAAIEAIRPGVAAQDVDAVARKIISEAGFGRQFGHGLGHGLGLEVHEGPRLAVNSSVTLKPGMVVTVEPGIYLPGWGGVRIEDDVLVTRTGHEVLTKLPKQWADAQAGV